MNPKQQQHQPQKLLLGLDRGRRTKVLAVFPVQKRMAAFVDPSTSLPVGPPVEDASPAPRPSHTVLEGRYCRLEPLSKKHAKDLLACSSDENSHRNFLYLFDSPPRSLEEMEAWIESRKDMFFAVVDKADGVAVGRQAFLRVSAEHRSVEIGHVFYGEGMARTRIATEANYLFAKHVFSLGYRRYEWKCDSLNARSRNAARRFGFTFEGIFRRAIIYKGRSRDTAWFAMIEEEWPRLEKAYELWLDPSNFESDGTQKARLSDLTKTALAASNK